MTSAKKIVFALASAFVLAGCTPGFSTSVDDGLSSQNAAFLSEGNQIAAAVLSADAAGDSMGVIDGLTKDASGATIVSGWACAKNSSVSILVHLYFNGPYGTGQFISFVTANLPGEAAIGQVCGDAANSPHRFHIPLDANLLAKDAGQSIYVYGISPTGGVNNPLVNSGTFHVPAAAQSAGGSGASAQTSTPAAPAASPAATGSPQSFAAGALDVKAGQVITVGSAQLTLQRDGNLVMYQAGQARWASSYYPGFGLPAGTSTSGLSCDDCHASFQPDGNLVLYHGNGVAYWATATGGVPSASFVVSEVAPFVAVTSKQGSFLWASGKLIFPNAPLVVDGSSSVVVMEYEAWFTPLSPLSTFSPAYSPLLTSASMANAGQAGYDSQDPAVINQHMAWLQSMGVNAITAEQTNAGPCDMNLGNDATCSAFLARIGENPAKKADYESHFRAINNSALNLYPALTASGTNIKIIPVLDGQDPEMYTAIAGAGGLTTALQNQLTYYVNYMNAYPNLRVFYQGKPLIIVYVGASQYPADPHSIYSQAKAFAANNQGGFTVRVMASLVGSQPQLLVHPGVDGLSVVNPDYQVWSWVDRLNPEKGLIPSYTTAGARNEAFTVAAATPGTVASNNDGSWNAADAGLYGGGQYLTLGLKDAADLAPLFLVVDGFNEYGQTDQGVDENHSNDLEPTKQWGYDRFNLAKKLLLDYESAVGRTLNGHP